MNARAPGAARWLQRQAHDVRSVYDEARGATDDEILDKAVAESWILITNDKDFGEMVFRDKRPHRGIIFLRLQNERTASKIDAVEKLLDAYANQLENAYVVVTETHVRIATSIGRP